MKLLFLLLVCFTLLIPAVRAQMTNLNHFIETHKHDQGFTFAYLSRDLFEVASKSEVKEKDWKKVQQIVKNVGSLRILAGDEVKNGLALYKEVLTQIPTDEFDELLTVRDEQTNVRIWAKTEEDKITDLILLVGSPDEFVLICFAGAIELGNITELAKLFDAEEAKDLAAVTNAVAIDFQISPNPSNGVFQLSYTDEQDAPALLNITDQNGRQVSMLRLSGSPTQQVELSDLPAGLYWIQLKTAQGKVGIKQVQIVKN